METKRSSLLWAGLALMALTVFVLACSEKNDAHNSAAGALPVEVATPLQKTVQTHKKLTGRFQAVEQSDVKARVSGYIVKANFSEGDFVVKGTPLFHIDHRPFQIELDAALANQERQKATLQEKETNFSMVNGLKESGAISAEEYERRRLAVQSSKSELLHAEAVVAEARLNLEFTTVRAPISGQVGRKLVTEGNLVSGGNENATLLTTIVQTNPIHFYVSASENDLADIISSNQERKNILGDSAKITLEGNTNRSISGKIDFIGNQLNLGTGSLEIRAIVDNKDEGIQPGLFGEALLYGKKIENALLVSELVIGSNQNIKFVYTLDENNQVKLTPIEIGGLYDGNMRLVTSGLTKQDKVIINNIQKVWPGMAVSPVDSSINNQITSAQ